MAALLALAVFNPFCCFNSFWLEEPAAGVEEAQLEAYVKPCAGKPESVPIVALALAIVWLFLACVWRLACAPRASVAALPRWRALSWQGPPRYLALLVIRV